MSYVPEFFNTWLDTGYWIRRQAAGFLFVISVYRGFHRSGLLWKRFQTEEIAVLRSGSVVLDVVDKRDKRFFGVSLFRPRTSSHGRFAYDILALIFTRQNNKLS